jgi:hypothetical protein
MPRATPRLTTSSLALTATAALLVSAVSMVAGPASPASAAAGTADKVVVSLPTTPGKPGVAQTGTVTVTDSSGAAVAGKTVALSLDHGFVTSGAPTTTTVGDRAGGLQASTTPVVTGANGQASFTLGIARDAGFDDDGAVTSAVTATADAASGIASATWSSASPLNGGSVDVALSPFQENPVGPTVSGDRTYYEVTTRDQFGNAVAGEQVQLFPAGTPSVDYSSDFVSNLDALGDFWVYSDDPGTVSTTVTWPDAPTFRYTGTAGQAAAGAPADVDGKATVSYYDVSFSGSRYSIGSSADGNLAVGTTVTKTVTVLDQLGRPVRGLDVQFFRVGPDSGGGDQKVDRETNSAGQASYSFVGSGAGSAKVTAVVSDGLSRKNLTSENGFRFNVAAVVAGAKAKDLKKAAKAAAKAGKGKKKGAVVLADELDVLAVRSDKLAAGAAVSVYAVKGSSLKPVKAKGGELDEAGRTVLSVKDKNAKKATSYVVVVGQTGTTFSATSAPAKVK